MINTPCYKPPVLSDWQGRIDKNLMPQYIYQVIKALDLSCNITAASNKSIALLGFACDVGVKRNQGRAGANLGPQEIKKALAQMPLHFTNNIYDAGSITVLNDDLLQAQQALATAVFLLLKKGFFPIVLGGGHETAFGHHEGINKSLGLRPLSILNFDAHFDLRPLPADNIGTSGTPFKQIAAARHAQGLEFNYFCVGIQPTSNTQSLFKTAKNLKTYYLLAQDIHEQGSIAVENFVDHIIKSDASIYLSLCLDVFSSAYAPGVSAPQVLGLTPWQILPSLKKLAYSGKVMSMDIVELAPAYDIDKHTSKLAAQLLALFL